MQKSDHLEQNNLLNSEQHGQSENGIHDRMLVDFILRGDS